jgi:DNA-binding NarL/FixJ family response regulator
VIPVEAAKQLVEGIVALIDENERLRKQISAGSTSSQRSNKKKLTKRDVSMMRDLKRLGASNQELAVAYDVHHATVSRTVRGIYWK